MSQKTLKSDQRVFYPSIILTIIVSLPLIYYADALQDIITRFYHFMTVSFGWSYLLIFLAGLVLSLYVSFSRFGTLKIGGANAEKKFGEFHWISMVIASGYGIGIVNWSMVEPVNTMALAPLGGGANSAYALEVASAYGFFHWGLLYWCVYLLPCIPIFYFLGVKNVKRQRVSECLTPLWGSQNTTGLAGTLFDLFVVVALIGGIGVTLGTAVPLVSGLLAPQIGLQDSKELQMGVLVFFTLITVVSVFTNIDKGMKLLSDFNSRISIFLLAIVLVFGPTAFILNLGTNSIGLLLDLLPKISTWTDPGGVTSYPAKWTIFYAAWILAYGPMMGIFITSISIGRTLKEVILGCLFWGGLASFLYFTVMGGFALYLQYTGSFDGYSFYLENGVAATAYQVLSRAPLSFIIKPIYLLVATVFLATTIDAAVRVLASMTTKEIYAHQEPPRTSRLSWAIVLGILVLGVLLVGGIDIIQFLAVGATIPLVLICVLMCVSMFKSFSKD